jgi:hypothetical protein
MAEARALRPHEASIDDWAVWLLGKGPVIAGVGADRIDWTCPQCHAVLVQGAVNDRQYLDLLFRCYACGAIARSATRKPGHPPAGNALLWPPGRYRLDGPVDVSSMPVMSVGKQATDGYMREIGSWRPGGGWSATPSDLRAMGLEAKQLLGEHSQRLIAKDERGRRSSTPPGRRHRLVELISYAREIADEIEAAGQVTAIDLSKLSELMATVLLFDRWRHHPMWPDLVATLADRNEGQHTVMMLTVASYLADAGNGIGLVAHGDGGGRIPDLWVEPGFLERLDIEVKTPQDLRGPRARRLTVDEATTSISRQLTKAAGNRRGQLDPTHTGILAVGGFHLDPGALDTLEEAATNVLAAHEGRKGHLAAVLVAELKPTMQEMRLETGLETRLVRHPSYRGGLEIHRGPGQ